MNLKAYLAIKNITLKEFAKSIDYSPSYLILIAKGKYIPSRKVCKLLEEKTEGVIKIEPKPRKLAAKKE